MLSKAMVSILGSLLFLMGCTGGSGAPTGSVSGTVSYNNQPVSEGTILLIPSGAGYVASAKINSDGSYRVTTQDGGVPVGEYAVVVTPPTIKTPDTPEGPGGEVHKEVDNIPSKYRSAGTSELKLSVTAGASQTFDINMVD